MIRWINTPCTDPAGRVFVAGDRIFRAIFPEQEAVVRAILEHEAVRALMEDGLVVRMWISETPVPGYRTVVEMEKAPFDVPCERLTSAALRQAALRWLAIYRRLLPAGLALLDAHFGNYMLFGIDEPRWVDLGGIRPLPSIPEEQPFRSFNRYWDGMLAPLALLATQPRHARLARLSMGDHAHQGPLTPSDEAPLAADGLLRDLRQEVFAAARSLGPEQAMDFLGDFIEKLPSGKMDDVRPPTTPATAVVKHVEKQFDTGLARSIICLGADSFRQFPGSRDRADVLVIDQRENELDALRREAASRAARGHLALYYGHPVNRHFLRNPPVGDAVLCVDPLAKYAHATQAESDNIAHILATLGSQFAVIVTTSDARARTEQMLRLGYASVATESFSWLGKGPVVVVGRR